MDLGEVKRKYRQAEALYQQGRPAEALHMLDELDQAFPNAQNVTYMRVLCFAALGCIDQAIELADYLGDVLDDPRGEELQAQLEAHRGTPGTPAKLGIKQPPKRVSCGAFGCILIPLIFVVLSVLSSSKGCDKKELQELPSVVKELVSELTGESKPSRRKPPARPARTPRPANRRDVRDIKKLPEPETPRTPSLGSYLVRDKNDVDGQWEDYADARPGAAFPAGKDVMLKVAPNAADLWKLSELDLDRLYAISVRDVPLDEGPAVGAVAAALGNSHNLRELILPQGRPINDRVLVKVSALTSLTALDLSQAQVGDAEMVCLSRLTSLRSLNLAGTQVGDAGLVHLARLTSLRRLDLSLTQVRGAGLVHLEGFTSLERLNLMGSQIEDAGLSHLANLTSLKELHLGNTQIGDAGLAYLRRLNSLERLDLHGTQVTNAGLGHLRRLTSLKDINLSRTKVTKEGKAAIEEEWRQLRAADEPEQQAPAPAVPPRPVAPKRTLRRGRRPPPAFPTPGAPPQG
jgi:hypothetical protein